MDLLQRPEHTEPSCGWTALAVGACLARPALLAWTGAPALLVSSALLAWAEPRASSLFKVGHRTRVRVGVPCVESLPVGLSPLCSLVCAVDF